MRRPSPGGAAAQGQRRRWFLRPIRFMGEVVSELKKVTWPSRQDALRLTLMVLAVSIALGLALGGIDYIFTHLTRVLLRS